MAVGSRHLFVIVLRGLSSQLKAYALSELHTGAAPVWQIGLICYYDDALAVSGGDWLIVGYVTANALAAVDVRGPPSDWKVSALTPLSQFGMGHDETLRELSGSSDDALCALLCDARSVYRALLLNTTVAVDRVAGARALTFTRCSAIPLPARVIGVSAVWGPPLSPGGPAALYIAEYVEVGAHLSLYVGGDSGRPQWTKWVPKIVGGMTIARGLLLAGAWFRAEDPLIVVLDAATGERSHGVPPGTVIAGMDSPLSAMAVVDDEFLLVVTLHAPPQLPPQLHAIRLTDIVDPQPDGSASRRPTNR